MSLVFEIEPSAVSRVSDGVFEQNDDFFLLESKSFGGEDLIIILVSSILPLTITKVFELVSLAYKEGRVKIKVNGVEIEYNEKYCQDINLLVKRVQQIDMMKRKFTDE